MKLPVESKITKRTRRVDITATAELAQILSPKDIEACLWAYRLIKDNEIKHDAPILDILKTATDIVKALKGPKRRKYIDDGGIKQTMEVFFSNLTIYDDPKKVGALLFELYFRGSRGGGPYRDRALDLLLGYLFEVWPGTPDYELIADFLSSELNIENITGRAIERRHKRISSEEINTTRRFYNVLGILFAQMTLEERCAAVIPYLVEAVL